MSRDIRTHKGRSIFQLRKNQGKPWSWRDRRVETSYAPERAPVRKYVGRCDCSYCESNRTYSSQRAQLSADMSLEEWLTNFDSSELDFYERFFEDHDLPLSKEEWKEYKSIE